jgi:hypothetical protein
MVKSTHIFSNDFKVQSTIISRRIFEGHFSTPYFTLKTQSFLRVIFSTHIPIFSAVRIYLPTAIFEVIFSNFKVPFLGGYFLSFSRRLFSLFFLSRRSIDSMRFSLLSQPFLAGTTARSQPAKRFFSQFIQDDDEGH